MKTIKQLDEDRSKLHKLVDDVYWKKRRELQAECPHDNEGRFKDDRDIHPHNGDEIGDAYWICSNCDRHIILTDEQYRNKVKPV